jgi:hypothetical protein
MTLFGKPIDAAGLRAAAMLSVAQRLEQMAFTGHDPGDEDRSERVFGHEL